MNLDQKPFDRSNLNHIDMHLRKLVDESYDLCLYKCTEKNVGGVPVCKSNCFKRIIVPYRFHNHAARDEEDNDYRRCLAEKFPNIQHSDYIECTQKLYKDRVQILSNYMHDVAEKVLSELH